jgi:cell division protein FtsW
MVTRWLLRRPQEPLLAAVFLLVSLGTVMVFSSSAFRYDDSFHFLRRHCLWLPIAALVCLLVSEIDYRVYRKYYPCLYLVTVVLLALVAVPGIGHEVNHSRRWLVLGSDIRLQPSEVAKLTVILAVAGFLSAHPDRCQRFWRGFLPVGSLVLVLAALIIVEPDLGSTLFVLGLAFVLFVVAGVRASYLVGAAMLLPGAGAVYFVLRPELVLKRLEGLFDPESVYQVRHSLLALGSGGFSGLGLGAGEQKLRYLPEAHTDFVLAVIGEELGFVGCIAVLALFLVLVVSGAAIAWRSRDLFGFVTATGITLSLGVQAAINCAVVTASAPTKGLPLPFVSFGGSGLCMAMAQVGILLSIARFSAQGSRAVGEKDAVDASGARGEEPCPE